MDTSIVNDSVFGFEINTLRLNRRLLRLNRRLLRLNRRLLRLNRRLDFSLNVSEHPYFEAKPDFAKFLHRSLFIDHFSKRSLFTWIASGYRVVPFGKKRSQLREGL